MPYCYFKQCLNQKGPHLWYFDEVLLGCHMGQEPQHERYQHMADQHGEHKYDQQQDVLVKAKAIKRKQQSRCYQEMGTQYHD